MKSRNVSRAAVASALVALAATSPTPASADPARGERRTPAPREARSSEAGQKDVILGVERIVGAYHRELSSPALDVDQSGQVIGLLQPQLGIDLDLGDVTLGASTSWRRNESVTTTTFAARVGHIVTLSETTRLWLRAGLGLSNTSVDTVSITALTLDVEPQFIFSPSEVWGVTLGLGLDFPLTGSAEEQSSGESFAVEAASYGLYSGLVIWL